MAGVIKIVLPALRGSSNVSRVSSVLIPFVQPAAGTRGFKHWVAPVLRILKNRQKKQGPQPIQPRNTYLEWNYDAEIFAFGARLNENFDEGLLRQAFTQKSYVFQEEKRQKELGMKDVYLKLPDNEDLAKRGAAIISDYTVRYLRMVLPYFPEEGIQAVCKYLSSLDVLADVSFHLGTKDLILCSEYPPEKETLARTLEAVVATLESSSGLSRAETLVRDLVLTRLVGLDLNQLWDIVDPMGALAGILRREGRGEPMPRLLWEAAPNSLLATYVIGIYSDKKLLGSGPGETVEIAQEMAARDALRRLFRTSEDMAPLPFGKRASEINVSKAPANNISVKEWTEKKVLSNVVQC